MFFEQGMNTIFLSFFEIRGDLYMVKNIIKTLLITGICTILSFSVVFADADPSNDTTRKIRLSTSATDNIDTPDKLYFAWYYNKVQTDGSIRKIPLTENKDSSDTKYFGTPYVKGAAGTQVDVSMTKYGNGVYTVECKDTYGNVSTENIDLRAWDVSGPADVLYTVTPDNNTPSSHKTIRILATEDEVNDSGLHELPYTIYGPTTDSVYNSDVKGKTSNQITSFINSKRTSEPDKMREWSDSTFTVDQEGKYILFVRDAAGNVSHTLAEIKKIDISVPEIEGIEVKCTDDCVTDVAYEDQIFNSSTAPNLVKLHVVVSDNCTANEELKYTWFRNGLQIAQGIGTDTLYLSPKSSAGLASAIGATTAATLPVNATLYNMSDTDTDSVKSANAKYKVMVEDVCKNKSTSNDLNLKIFDFTNPTMDAPTYDTAEVVQSNTIHVNNLADNIGFDEKPLIYHKQGETGERTANRIYTVPSNGQYVIELYDMAGNKITKTVSINNLDTTAPVIRGYAFSNNSGKVRITVDATDTNSNGDDTTERLQYCLATNSGSLATSTYWQDTKELDYFGTSDITSGTYWLGVRDRAGNMTYQSITVNKDYVCGTLEEMSPEKLKSYVTQSPETGVWTNGNVELTVTLPSIIERPQFSFNSGTYQSSNKKSYESNGSVVIAVKDIYGNIYTADSYSIRNIDKTLPSISTELNANGNKVTITVSDEELSKLHKITVTPKDGEEVTIHDYSGTNTGSDAVEYLVPANGEYTFKVYDKAGNIASDSRTITGAITDNTELTPENIAARIIKSPLLWTNGDVTLKLALNSTAGLAEVPYKWTGQTEYCENNEFVVSQNGKYRVTVKDSFGNQIESDEVTVDNIDKVAPGLDFHLNDNSNALLITATDELSNVQKITVEGGTYTNETTIKDAGGSLLCSALATQWSVPVSNTTYTFRAYDNAGNVKEIEVEVGVSTTDNEDLTPVNLQKLITQNPSGWTNGDVTLTLALTNTAELDENPYSWNNGTSWSTSRIATVTKNGSYKVQVKDHYGNVIISDPYTVANIDKKDPSVDIQYKDDKKNTVVFSMSDAVTEESEGMSGIDKLTLCTVVDGNTTETVIYEELKNEAETATAEWAIPQKGDYVFKLYDRAGNSIVKDVTFNEAIAYNDELDRETLALRVSKAPSDWTRGNVKLQLTLNDTSNLAEKPFKWGVLSRDLGFEGTEQFIYLTEFTADNSVVATDNGQYFVIVKDKFGNETRSDYVRVSNIDRETYGYGAGVNPEASISENGTVTLKLTDRDPLPILDSDCSGYKNNCESGLAKVTVQGETFAEETVIKEFAEHPLDATASFRAPAIGTYTIRSYDVAGNVFDWDVYVDHAITDNEELNDPDVLFSKIRSDAEGKLWVAAPVRLTLDLSSFDGLAPNAFKWSIQNDYSNANYVDVYDNADYAVTVKDIYNNENTSSPYTVSNIDNVDPVLSLRTSEDGTQLIYEASDGESGVSRIVWSGGALESLTPIKTWQEPQSEVNGSVAFPNNGIYTVTVYDAVGNSAAMSIQIEGISAPNMLLDDEGIGVTNSISRSPTRWTNGNVIVSIDMADKTGVDPNGYKWTYSAGVTDETQEFIGTKSDRTSIVVTKNGVAKVVVTDDYGKEFTSKDVIVDNIDKVAPTGTCTIKDEHNNTFVLSLRDMPPEGEDAVSGIDKVVFCRQVGETTTETVLYNEPEAEIDALDVEWTIPSTGKYIFKVYDRAGNVSSFESDEITSIVTYNDEINDPAVLARKIRSNKEDLEWTAAPVRLSVELNSFEGLAAAPFKWSTQEEYSNTNYVDIYENGDYSITVKDAYGNEVISNPFTVANIDNVNPALELGRSEDGTKLLYSASDEQSGITRIVWEGGALGALTPIQAWPSPQSEISGEIPFPNNGEYVVTVYDACGNAGSQTITVSDISAPNNLLDDQGVGVTSSVSISPTKWTNGNVTVSIDMANKTGVDPNGYLWTTEAPVTEDTQAYIGVKGDRTSIILTENGTARVTVTDDYGKEFTSDVITVGNIDKVAPVVTCELNDASNSIHVAVTDNLSGIAKICYKFNDGAEATSCSLSSHALEVNKDIPVNQNGVYTILAYDNAENVAVKIVEVASATTGVITNDYVNQHIKYSTTGYTNGDVTIILDIPDKNLLDSQPYSWDGGATWSTTNTRVVGENGTYTINVKDKYGNIYQGTAIVANIDRADPTLGLFQNGNSLQITVGDNSQISKVGMNRPNDRYEETLKVYKEGTIYDTFAINLNHDGVYTVTVYDAAGNKTIREINVVGLSLNSNNSPLLDENSKYTNGETEFSYVPANNNVETQSNTPANNPNNNTGNTNVANNPTNNTETTTITTPTTPTSGTQDTITKEYHYDTKKTEDIKVVNQTTSGSSSNNSNTGNSTTYVYEPVYVPQYISTPVATNTYSQQTTQSPAVVTTPIPTQQTTSGAATTATAITTTKPTPTPAATKTANSGVTTTSTSTTTSAKKVTPTNNTASSTFSTSKSSDIVVENTTKEDNDETLDAKAMYRNARVEQTEQEEVDNKADPKVGLMILGAVLGVALIGAGIYAFTKRKEQKQTIAD